MRTFLAQVGWQNDPVAERFSTISADLAQWWREQPMFFVATAPLDAAGHVNVSPKGYDTLRILGENRGRRISI